MKVLHPLRAGGYPGTWVGRFIWDGGEASPYHLHLMCRKAFDLETAPVAARILVAVADKCMLWVNGEYIGRGPCRTPGPQWVYYDTHDLAGRLRPGRNVIAILALHYGRENNFSVDQRAGLWVQLEAARPDGTMLTLGSDASWKVRRAEGWRRDVGQNGAQGMPLEFYEAGKDPEDWFASDFDDTAWAAAVEASSENDWVPNERAAAWEYLEPRLTPLLREREVFPVRVATLAESEMPVRKVIAETDIPERMAGEDHLPLARAVARDVESLVNAAAHADATPSSRAHSGGGAASTACFASRDGRDPVIVFDFGRPYMGIPRLTFTAEAGAVVEMTFGNTLKEGRVPAVGSGYRYGSRHVARAGRQTWQPFEPQTATRYLQIVFRTQGQPLILESVSLISLEYPVEERGSFACSDETLTTLWRAGVDTNYLHLEDCYTCDAVRERHAYMMCGEIEQSHWAYYAAYGDIAATDLNFRQTSRMQAAGGQLRAFLVGMPTRGFPSRTLPLASAATASFAPTFSGFFAEAVLNRQRWFPKAGFVEEHWPTLVRLAEWFERQAGDDGLIVNPPPIVWFDWPNFRKWQAAKARGANFGVNALWYRMLADMAELARRSGQDREAARRETAAERIRAAIRSQFWDADRGLFVDFVENGRRRELYSELFNGWALLFGLAAGDQRPAIVRNLLAPTPDLTRVSPLYFNYVIEALLREGQSDYAWHYMAERYAPVMALSDFPTLVEEWTDSPHGINSTIHGTPGGVVLTLSRYALGVFPLEDGYRRVLIQPHIGGLKWARGVVPSSTGDIRIAWERHDNELRLDVTLPEGVRAEFAPPPGFDGSLVITHHRA